MPNLPNIHINDYDYPLTDDNIAKYPLQERDHSKLLVYKNQTISHILFKNLPDVLPDKSLLIFNNTRVVHARIRFRKPTGANIEIFCLEPHQPKDYYLIFQATGYCQWKCLIGNKRKWKSGIIQTDVRIQNKVVTLQAEVKGSINESFIVGFTWNMNVTFGNILENIGNIPIPPYLKRNSEKIDLTRYQTVYSQIQGSVAAPTAGLHFTPALLDKLAMQGFQREEITLHVGAGTFQPVKADKISNHTMHTEHFAITRDVLIAMANAEKVIAVGTTSLRTIESIFHLAYLVKNGKLSIDGPIALSQWEGYGITNEGPPKRLLLFLADQMIKKGIDRLTASTQIMIAPGYKFKVANGLITNFHLPKSTLLLLVAAFVGGSWKKIYEYALNNQFRFLSYGDSSILLP